MRTAFTLALATAATAIRVQHDTPEQAACQCLDSSGASVYFPTGDVADAYIIGEFDGETQYPWNYGVGECAAWDEGLFGFECDTDAAPGYCTEPWCYVSEECALFEDVTASDVVEGAFYSYNACGGDGDAPRRD